MSALGIGLAWAAMAAAAFIMLSATALARTRNDLEAGPGALADMDVPGDAHSVLDRGVDSLLDRGGNLALTAAHGPLTRAHWAQRAQTTTMLRSSPSLVHMTASTGRPRPIRLS